MKRLNLLVIAALLLGLLGLPPVALAAGPWYVDAASGNDGNSCLAPGAACKTVQGAIAKASANDTINVAAGTYVETGQILISRNLTIIGANKTTTIIKPSADTASSGDGRGWWFVTDGTTLNLSKVTLDGSGHKVWQGIRYLGQGVIDDCLITNIKYDPSGASYAGTAIAVFGAPAMNVDVTNCTFSEIGRVGVLFYGSGVTASTFRGNTYTGKGAGDWLDYGVEVGAGAHVDISDNTISGCLGEASVDGSTSSAVLVSTYYGAGSTATITGNSFTGNTAGIAIGFDGSDTSAVVAHNNIIVGNTYGIDSTAPAVNAENNWWGCSAGPGNPGCDSAVSPVDFTPWLAARPAEAWTKYSGNPVAANPCGVASPVRPQIVWESTNNYKMYFTDHSNWASTYLATTSDGGLHWTCATGGAPVVTTGGAGAWDEARASGGTVVKDGASDYKMWYGGRAADGVYAVGYATSADGVTWTKHGSNPVMTAGSPSAWDGVIVREMNVVHVGGTYHMWYSGGTVWPYFKIGHATSPDGITWTKDAANPVLSTTAGSWDAMQVYAPSVVWDSANSQFVMFYSGSLGNPWLTGYATSPNGSVWTKAANAVLSPDGAGAFDSADSTDYVGAVLDGSSWKLFYSGGSGYQIGLMTPATKAQLTLRQLSSAVQTGASTDVYIDLNAVRDMYGYQFVVAFDQTKVSASGAFVNSFFDTTANAFVAWNHDCASTPGQCKFSATKQNPAPALTGSGPLAKITFTGVAAGLARLQITSDILSTKEAEVIANSKTTGWLNVFGTATIQGTVNLQGRTTPKDATGTVTLYAAYGAFPPVVTHYGAASGAWSASVPVGGSGTVYALAGAHALYLTNQLGDARTPAGITATAGGTFTAPTTKLLGGDATNSGKVDLGDLTCIGGAFGGAPTTCGGQGSSDINADLIVNILDLVLAGGNYDLRSSQPW